ncbi:hypothetical protein RF11_06627 [Thelohanellus kitauei]|uniref:Uncharacterized protein n=1 Tax=Thelohanellus kitauei TaxID=669202 RepID=A0A0C2MCD8_THEKT|nr:hypothetical protein RF11_06627 [Thelohanellus kitauei]
MLTLLVPRSEVALLSLVEKNECQRRDSAPFDRSLLAWKNCQDENCHDAWYAAKPHCSSIDDQQSFIYMRIDKNGEGTRPIGRSHHGNSTTTTAGDQTTNTPECAKESRDGVVTSAYFRSERREDRAPNRQRVTERRHLSDLRASRNVISALRAQTRKNHVTGRRHQTPDGLITNQLDIRNGSTDHMARPRIAYVRHSDHPTRATNVYERNGHRPNWGGIRSEELKAGAEIRPDFKTPHRIDPFPSPLRAELQGPATIPGCNMSQ